MFDYYIGVMSGTSVDAVDAVLCQIDQAGQVKHLDTVSAAFPAQLTKRLHHAMSVEVTDLVSYKALEGDYSHHVIKAVKQLLTQTSLSPKHICAIGCHGQTLWHYPPSVAAATGSPFSLQLINAALIAWHCRINVISDFRQKDIVAGGEGAPLVPAFHYHALAQVCPPHTVILNLGGIANMTYLGTNAAQVIGFDSGPANTLLDAYFRHQWGAPGYDKQGKKAAMGNSIERLLKQLLRDPYFYQSPPKSTGREYFNLSWLQQNLDGNESPQDVLRTLVNLTAESIYQALDFLPQVPAMLVACGGGVRNPLLMQAISHRIAPLELHTTSAFDIDPQAVEAIAFAWLAWCYEHKKPGNLPAATGARSPVILGNKTYAG